MELSRRADHFDAQLNHMTGDFQPQGHFITGLTLDPDAAAILARGIWSIRPIDFRTIEGEVPHIALGKPDTWQGGKLPLVIQWVVQFSLLLEAAQTGAITKEVKARTEELGCTRLISTVLEYQSVATVLGTSTKPSQSTNQPPSATIRAKEKKAAKRSGAAPRRSPNRRPQ